LMACTFAQKCPSSLPRSRYHRPPGNGSNFMGSGVPSGVSFAGPICSRSDRTSVFPLGAHAPTPRSAAPLNASRPKAAADAELPLCRQPDVRSTQAVREALVSAGQRSPETRPIWRPCGAPVAIIFRIRNMSTLRQPRRGLFERAP
jgi:hypothetical protein